MRYLIFIILFTSSCARGPQPETEIYFNDFESNDLQGISSGKIDLFNSSKVLGRYNAGGFKLTLEDLPDYDLIEISFDLYLHDSWDGNLNGDNVGGPDIWSMNVNGDPVIYATFSNGDCPVQTCEGQSYPANYPNYNNGPKSGAFRRDLPGVCHLAGVSGGTSQYKIRKILRLSGRILTLECLDHLKQTNSPNALCDESWSVDNIKIKGIRIN